MTTARPDIFLSYSREDKATAHLYADALRQEGFSVWWDQTLNTGEAYDAVTEQALDAARAVVVLWSRTSVGSRWVRAEATIADRNGVLMPVMIEPCRRPVMFELTQTSELTHWKGDTSDPGWRKFTDDLKRLMLRSPSRDSASMSGSPAAGSSAIPDDGRAPVAPGHRRTRLLQAAAAIFALVVVALSLLGLQHTSREKQARAMMPQIARLVDAGDFSAAFERAKEVRRYIPDDPLLASLTPLFTATYSIKSDPEGAEVYARRYAADKEDWIHIGRTPLDHVELPRRATRWRFEKAGFEPVEAANSAMANQDAIGTFLAPKAGVLEVKLWPQGQQPADMVFVPGIPAAGGLSKLPPAKVPSYFIDRYEVTNAQFKEFVDAGGYERRQYWEGLDLRKNGNPLSFDEAMKLFTDTTGRPGPANWELGSFPAGKGDYPVSGISWYEASAYARFRNKVLPSAYHWTHAAAQEDEIAASFSASIVPLSNFGTNGPSPVGTFQGIGPHGTYDLFGNVREWVSNPGPAGGWVMGGDWEDPPYAYSYMVAVPLLERSKLTGFRLMKPGSEEPDIASLHGAIDGTLGRTNIPDLKPVSDDVFATYQRQFAYRSGPVNASTPQTMSTTDDWIQQRVTIDTGYEGKRMDVILFVPRNAHPPLQPVILFSGLQMFLFPASSKNIEPGFAALPLDYIVKSGRILVQPIFEGTFERFKAPINFDDEVGYAREALAWRWDLGRTIDYLESRTDVDARRIGYIGLSFGASAALPVVATEPRLKAAVFVSGGIPPQNYPPQADPLNFASRITIPTLMINGRYDPNFTVEGNQLPLYRLLGTAAADKRHVLLEYGHGSPPRGDVLRETLGWYDKYLGEVGH
jgi:predicted esterase